ncbi:hypothetical protein JVT61DRAFT_10815 [Boletus reticuloceps]|uniref:Uncharacterized protein n=1 Tax=Boletus reticuloceps TaxID=495285 RepID=A0A8I3A553_9AGAM|nr:hypothetical protein JVT61DRAFT_10815 [Boletus reticuloceps]
MPAHSWATKEQQAWLIEYQQKYYLPLMPNRNYTSFWNPFFEAFTAKWPEREWLLPGIPEAKVTPEQQGQITAAIKDCKNPVVAGSSKLPDLLVVEQEGWHLSSLEVFSNLYYKSHVKHLVETEDEKTPVDVIQKATITAWQSMQANKPEKAQTVMEECKRRKEEREKELEERENPTVDQITATIRRAPTLLINALQKVQKGTRWSFTLLFGGPDLDSGGSLHLGWKASISVKQMSGGTLEIAM